MVGGAVGRHRMMHTRTSLVFAKDSGREEKTPLLHSLRSAVLVCLDTTRFVRDGDESRSRELVLGGPTTNCQRQPGYVSKNVPLSALVRLIVTLDSFSAMRLRTTSRRAFPVGFRRWLMIEARASAVGVRLPV
jgi:hypothetical protein